MLKGSKPTADAIGIGERSHIFDALWVAFIECECLLLLYLPSDRAILAVSSTGMALVVTLVAFLHTSCSFNEEYKFNSGAQFVSFSFLWHWLTC